jgi:plastocyanin
MQTTSRLVLSTFLIACSGFAACGDPGGGSGGEGGEGEGGAGTASSTGTRGGGGEGGAATGSGGSEGGAGGAGGEPECDADEDCPGTVDPCKVGACFSGACGLGSAPDGKPTPTQTNGDCKMNVCMGGVEVAANDEMDAFDDNNTCTEDVCSDGTPMSVPGPVGEPCMQNGGFQCNAAGLCVVCLIDGDCLAGESCVGGFCAEPSCVDGVKNGAETDVDCGGPCPSKCGPGGSCKMNSDCASASCAAATLTCDSTCNDGFKGGAETDVDCGGGACPACGVMKACGADADCATTVCSGGTCATINGCDPASATDLTGQDPVTITFDFFFYNPPCIRVSPGTKVIFSGQFASHPLAGGKIIGGVEMPDAGSPFMPITSSGMSKTFTLASSGTFPYYCDVHSNMSGAVFVQ